MIRKTDIDRFERATDRLEDMQAMLARIQAQINKITEILSNAEIKQAPVSAAAKRRLDAEVYAKNQLMINP